MKETLIAYEDKIAELEEVIADNNKARLINLNAVQAREQSAIDNLPEVLKIVIGL